MVWVKLDDAFVSHPRMVRAGRDGRSLFIAGLCYCGAHLTDGRIPKGVVRMLAAQAEVSAKTAVRLVEVGSWIDHGDEYEVHDFLVYNPTREKVLGDRESAKDRMRSRRSSGERSGGTSASPPRPAPTPKEISSPDGSDRELPTGLWMKVALEKLKLQREGAVTDPDSWLPSTARNAERQLAGQAATWFDEFDLSASQLACALATGRSSPTWGCYRRRKS